jgi:hypothetical protein
MDLTNKNVDVRSEKSGAATEKLGIHKKNYLITPAYLGKPTNDRASWMTWFCCSISFSDICRMVSIVVNLGRNCGLEGPPHGPVAKMETIWHHVPGRC